MTRKHWAPKKLCSHRSNIIIAQLGEIR